MKCLRVLILSICLYTGTAISHKEKCNRCVTVEQCPLFKELPQKEQKNMLDKFPCDNQNHGNAPYGFSNVAKGDYICCPAENVWGIEDTKKQNIQSHEKQSSDNSFQIGSRKQSHETHTSNEDSRHETSESDDEDSYQIQENADEYEKNRGPSRRRHHPQHNRYEGYYTRQPINQYPNSGQTQSYYNRPNANYPIYGNNFNNQPNNFNNQQFPRQQNGFNRPNGNFPSFNNQNGNDPYYNYPNSRIPNTQNERPFNQNGNFGNGAQCVDVIRLAPSPDTGCCGQDLSHESRTAGSQNGYMNRQGLNSNGWGARRNDQTRFVRSPDNDTAVNVSIDNRIIGGRETELEQYPWTVLLKTTFNYGDKESAFNCGGSLISSQYVLTAAHCIYEEGARVKEIEINLAEYDKRTFPQDCVNVPGEGSKCIDNVVMEAESAIPHPQYDDSKLQNDIALIKIRGVAPYTDYIRPICLPPINIDNPAFSDLRLAVAGWGRNGRYTSQVKQSTVVNLVPQRECSRNYPDLSRKHLCAAGHSGEDTCKGDSGGPLMMLYQGKYYVSGVVSGKRSDSPCGTSVPSLYTNVYHYLDWIKSNIRN